MDHRKMKTILLMMGLSMVMCSTLPYGKIQGQLIGEKSESPVSEGIIIPWWIENNVKATAVIALATEVGDDGRFEIKNLPPGKYVLFYSTHDSSKAHLNMLQGASIPLSLEPFLKSVRSLQEDSQVKEGLISKTIPSIGILDDLESGITIQAGSTFDYDNNGLVSGGTGSLLLTKYGFSANYRDGKITSLKMPSRGVANISIQAWGL